MERKLDWSKANNAKVNTEEFSGETIEDVQNLRKKIEPWLSAIFQSEHLSLLVGSGLTTSVSHLARTTSTTMSRLDITNSLSDKIKESARKSAEKMGRGEPNLEDDLRAAYELLTGLNILGDSREAAIATEVENKLLEFINSILKTEADFLDKLLTEKTQEANNALLYLKTFLLSFSSRAASRERLNLFTTNYDRFIEYGCDDSGIIVLDRFKGKILPVFRTTKLELDYHYNPPGIRGEPRYVEGVIRLTKLHGSVDWRFKDNRIVRCALPFGAKAISSTIPHPELPKNPRESVVIYPNSAKDIETAFYPYAELFRDFSTSICRPNSVVVTYGYSFGDSHINRVIEDMLTIPSTHLVIISFDDKTERIRKLFNRSNRSQITLLIGNHFGDLTSLVDNYLPKSSIDRITSAMQNILEKRGERVNTNANDAITSDSSTTNSPAVRAMEAPTQTETPSGGPFG